MSRLHESYCEVGMAAVQCQWSVLSQAVNGEKEVSDTPPEHKQAECYRYQHAVPLWHFLLFALVRRKGHAVLSEVDFHELPAHAEFLGDGP